MAVKKALHQGMFNEDEGLRRPSPLEAINDERGRFYQSLSSSALVSLQTN